MNTFRSRPEQLTWDKFMQNIALNLISGGVFSRLDKVLDPRAQNIVANMPMNVRRDLLRGLGRKATDKDLEKLVSAVGDNVIQGAYNAAVADVLKRATGKETPQVIQQRVIEKTLDRMMIARLIAVQNARNIIR